MDWRGFIYPRFSFSHLARGLLVAAIGAVVGGLYGIVHDQVTYSISEEYFTRNKFHQFAYARPSFDSPRWFAGIIGFLATWWVGALVAWVLVRVSISREGQLASPPPAREIVCDCFFRGDGCGFLRFSLRSLAKDDRLRTYLARLDG